MSDIAKVMRARTTIVPEYTPTGSRGSCGYVAKPDTECIAAADEIDRLRARIAELERAQQFEIGQRARLEIELGMIRQIVDGDQDCYNDDYWTSMHDAVRKLVSAQQWQTIETAPADVPLLLYCPDRGPANEERFECREYRNTRGGTQHAWATHWMPLPEAPKP